MPKKISRPQLRRCGFCTKVGHNKSTCPLLRSKQKNQPANNPSQVNFFVHHVTTAPPASPHIVNLKKHLSPLWEGIEAASPKKSINPTYHFYHQQKRGFQAPPPSRAEIVAVEAVASRANRILEQPEPYAMVLPYHKTPTLSSLPPNTEASRAILAKQDRLSLRQKLNNLQLKRPKINIADWRLRHAERVSDVTMRLENIAQSIGESFRLLIAEGPKKRSIAIALLIITVIGILPLPARSYYVELQKNKLAVVENSTAGFKALEDSTHQLLAAELEGAEDSTHLALSHFDNALTTLEKYSWLETIVGSIPIVKDQLKSRERLLLAGQQIAVGNSYLLASATRVTSASTTPLMKTNQLLSALVPALPNYQKALVNLNDVNPDVLPEQYRTSFEKFRTLFEATVTDLESIAAMTTPINEIFGGKGLRRYLIAFQNPSELRPTGGFIGSFAILEVKDGAITQFDIPPGGSYDLQGQLDQFIEPPVPLLLTNKRWEFQDANWFPDFPASSEKLLWFYRHSRGVTLDGVIAVNATVLERLLALTGPITDEKRGLTLTAEAALPTIQEIVEEGPEKKINKPKQILGDIAPTLLKRLTTVDAASLVPLLKNIEEALGQKEIQAYFTDQATQNTITSFGWSGKITETLPGQDYLLVVNTNIQGQKSDANIKQAIDHEAVVNDDGTVTNTVTITRTHQGSADEKLYGATNIDYLRVYVPAGSTLLAASGFAWPDDTSFRAPESWYKKDSFLSEQEKLITIDAASGTHIVSEFGKTSFGNWLITPPGQTSQVQFSYRLPFTILNENREDEENFFTRLLTPPRTVADYQLVVQRQSGSPSSFGSKIIFPTGWKPLWKNGNQISLAKNGAEIIVESLDRDTIWAFAMEKNN